MLLLAACFKPGTLQRMEDVVIKDETKLLVDEVKELEGDMRTSVPKDCAPVKKVPVKNTQ
jgi:hypothetical protein